MKQRIFLTVILCIFSSCLLFGIIKRQTYPDITSQNNYLDNLQVALLSESLVTVQCEMLEEAIPNVPIIVKVKAIEEIKHSFGISQQKVKILNVFKGNELQKDMELNVYSDRWQLSLSVEPKSLERGFVNIMEVGEEYLLFLDKQVKNLSDSTLVYRLCDDTFIAPVFGYKDRETAIAKTGETHTYVSYANVKNNEFFCDTELGHTIWKELKMKLFELYP